MNERRWGLSACAALALCAGAPFAAASGDSLLTDLKWLARGADRVEHLTTFVPEPVAVDSVGSYEFELGRVAFRSPGLLGGVAAREGLRCQTCHMNGRSNPNFFLAGLSSEPGTVDTTTAVFSSVLGDGVSNPIAIPTLEGVKDLAPYGHDEREPSLPAFVRTVIVDEFAGRAPPPVIFDALMTYMSALRDMSPPRRQPITLTHELADLGRAADVLAKTMENDDKDTAAFVIFAMRSQLGRINERLRGPALNEGRGRVSRWSYELRLIRQKVDGGDMSGAKRDLESWRRRVGAQKAGLTAVEKKTLFDPESLRAVLEGVGSDQ